MIERTPAPQRGEPNRPSQARWMKAAPRREMNRRSPRVVSMARIPRRGAPPGRRHCQRAMAASRQAMKRKKTAVCQVQAIQERIMRRAPSDAAEGEALRDVLAHEVDHEGAGDDGQGAGRGEKAELVAGAARGPGHGG